MSIEDFRAEVRDWLEANCPQSMRTPLANFDDNCWGGRKFKFASEDQRIWLERCAAKGYTVPTWPKDYGGAGLSKEEAKVLEQEMYRIKARPALQSFGIWMLGPALLEFGTHEQKLKYLPPIARGEIRWCQGYSEPGAGSDLASLRTKGEDMGDHYLVNGQKVWTSYADKSDWIFCLVRTEPDAPKHKGISFLLFDMETDGVSTKPIKLISGSSPFCETFFDDVKVPSDQIIGDRGNGWTIAKYLLTHERKMIGDMGLGAQRPISTIAKDKLADESDQLSDPMLRAEIAAHEMDAAAFNFTVERVIDESKAGASLGAFSSALKYYGTELNKDRHELMLKIHGSEAFEWEGQYSDDGAVARDWLRTKANSIEGGTSEVQLNIISKRILELPDR